MTTTSLEAPTSQLTISSEDALVAAMAAVNGDRPLHPVGAGGSKSPCFGTRGTALRFARYDQVVAVDGADVTIQAGATVAQLNAALAAHGLALPTNGEWGAATVAGSMASGTHGGSSRHSILASSAVGLRLVTVGGNVLDLRRGDREGGGGAFDHAVVSLGLLGVISTITFRCEEAFHLELAMRVVPFSWYATHYAAENRDHEFHAAAWIPAVNSVITFSADRVPTPARARRRRERFSAATFLLNRLARDFGIRSFPRAWFTATTSDRCDHVLTPIRNGSTQVPLFKALSADWRETELAVPISRAGEAFEGLAALIRRYPRVLTNSVGLRATAADTASLSPCYGRDTWWFALFYRRHPAFERELCSLFERLDARSHWGKHVVLCPEHIRAQYPRWDAFRRMRTVCDPDGVLANDFSRRFSL
ncbi:MAG TPA: D-arabinono-1,4-lactone oxidase [Gemmatimonadales bacterium]|nr:D-arabinono-1,4-lactone oxidase [Gemmatimonadales bacterium]